MFRRTGEAGTGLRKSEPTRTGAAPQTGMSARRLLTVSYPDEPTGNPEGAIQIQLDQDAAEELVSHQ